MGPADNDEYEEPRSDKRRRALDRMVEIAEEAGMGVAEAHTARQGRSASHDPKVTGSHPVPATKGSP